MSVGFNYNAISITLDTLLTGSCDMNYYTIDLLILKGHQMEISIDYRVIKKQKKDKLQSMAIMILSFAAGIV